MIRLFTKTRRRKTRDGFSPSPLIRELDAAGYVRVTDAVTADQPSEITQAQFQGLVSGAGKTPGYRTVLFGDSMTDTYETISVPTVTYDAPSGVATVTLAGHQAATGWTVYLWSRSYPGTDVIKGFSRTLTRVDANTFTVQLPANMAGIPASWASALCRLQSRRSAQALVPWLQAVSGQRFDIVYNGALSGDTTQNALDRIDRDCIAYSPQVVLMHALGINDTSPGNGNIKDETISANQQQIVDRILASGARLVIGNLTPVVAGEAAGRGTLANMARVLRLNKALREYCQNKPGVIFVDTHKKIVDPADATGLALPNMLRTTDKIHYSMRGGRAVAEHWWSQIADQFPSDNSNLPTSALDTFWAAASTLSSMTRAGGVVTATAAAHSRQVGETYKLAGGGEAWNEYVVITAVTTNTLSFVTAAGEDGPISSTARLSGSTNLVPNCLLTTATGGGGFAGAGVSTGVFAGNIRVVNYGTAAHVGSVVARADGFGNNQRVVITPAAAGNQVSITNDFTTYTTDLPLLMKEGRSYVFDVSLSLSGVSGSNLSELRVIFYATVEGVTYSAYATNGYADGAALNSDFTDYHFRTAPFLMPSGVITLPKWEVLASFSAAGTALTLDIGRLRLTEIA